MNIVKAFSQNDPHAPSEYHQYFWFKENDGSRFGGHPTKASIGDFCYFTRAEYLVGRSEIIEMKYVEEESEWYDGTEVYVNGWTYTASPRLSLLRQKIRPIPPKTGTQGFRYQLPEEQYFDSLFIPKNVLSESEVRTLRDSV
jgi:hypothetical protein